ncbi:MAG: endoribonuclease L-PSP [Tannerellaceae bacterium]|nr:endoribonuclease L-PSP [Tannerellaceae bacterium]
MSYCNKIQYKIYTTAKDRFPVMVEKLLAQLPEQGAVLRLAFFGMPPDNEEYLLRRELLKEKVREKFGDQLPALSYVSQPPLHTSLIMEAHLLQNWDHTDHLYCRCLDGLSYVIWENPYGRFLYAGGFQTDILQWTIEKQSAEVFNRIGKLLHEENFPVHSIVRQWNYIERITDFEGENQHYQSFNNARSDFYTGDLWPQGYPAATGIGTNLGGILVDLDAAVFTSPEGFVTPIDNKLQVAAHAYSGQVLAEAQHKKATPKFERAKSITAGSDRLVYISGTAAIRGEESLTGVGLDRQLHITMENIAQLTGNAEIRMLRVYLKEKKNYSRSKKLMESYGFSIPVSYMWADVCRDELLIEIEGIAIEKKDI